MQLTSQPPQGPPWKKKRSATGPVLAVLATLAVIGAIVATIAIHKSDKRNAAAAGTAKSSACGSTCQSIVATETEPRPKPKPKPADTRNATYTSLDDLRDAAVRAGYACPDWVEDDKVLNAAESGACSADDVFAIYASDSDRDAQIAQTRVNNETLIELGIEPSIVLFGPNWSINLPTKASADKLAARLGGVETK